MLVRTARQFLDSRVNLRGVSDAALDPEGRPLAGLADPGAEALAEMGTQGQAEAHHGGALAFSQQGGIDGHDVDI